MITEINGNPNLILWLQSTEFRVDFFQGRYSDKVNLTPISLLTDVFCWAKTQKMFTY